MGMLYVIAASNETKGKYSEEYRRLLNPEDQSQEESVQHAFFVLFVFIHYSFTDGMLPYVHPKIQDNRGDNASNSNFVSKSLN